MLALQYLEPSAATAQISPAAAVERLQRDGISSTALQAELKNGLNRVKRPLLAGVELVDLPGITRLNANQIQADLQAVQALPAISRLALSWDLWHMPPGWLRLVKDHYCDAAPSALT